MRTVKFSAMPKKLLIGLMVLSLCLVGCGFKMRGQAETPFQTLYTNIPKQTPFGIYIFRLLKAGSPNLTIVDTPDQADVTLTQLSFSRNRTEVSLDANGKIEEYELGLVFRFTVSDRQGNILVEPSLLSATRLLPYDENEASAKSAEMSLLYSDMEKSIADRLYRRILSEEVIEQYRRLNTG